LEGIVSRDGWAVLTGAAEPIAGARSFGSEYINAVAVTAIADLRLAVSFQ
jgi:hypothetical protein